MIPYKDPASHTPQNHLQVEALWHSRFILGQDVSFKEAFGKVHSNWVALGFDQKNSTNNIHFVNKVLCFSLVLRIPNGGAFCRVHLNVKAHAHF